MEVSRQREKDWKKKVLGVCFIVWGTSWEMGQTVSWFLVLYSSASVLFTLKNLARIIVNSIALREALPHQIDPQKSFLQGVIFLTGPPPEGLKYGEPRSGEVWCI